VPVDQSGKQQGIPERFAPKEMRGQLIEAEHLTRYRWAAGVAGGKRVLDAGCGTAYGTAILGQAGAEEVLGVDIAEGVLDSVRGEMPEAVRLEVGDLTQLELEDDSFDLIVCFEVIEHFVQPELVLDQLTRVLAPGGLMLISSPNRGVFPPGNPHHHHEFIPAELRATLQGRFANVRLMRQQSYVTCAIFSDERFELGDERPIEDTPVTKLAADKLDHELFTLALASDGPLPEMPSLAMMTASVSLDTWTRVTEEQEQVLQAHRKYIQELEYKVSGQTSLQQRLLRSELELARIPDLEAEIEELKSANHALAIVGHELHSTTHSISWRITHPLRAAKVRLNRLLARQG
jgi:SAM-dependent methyltransferase